MAWQDLLKTLAPTVATALVGPAGGIAVRALSEVFGLGADAKAIDLEVILEQGRLTPEMIAKIKELELTFQNDEKERGFRYAELIVQDRKSAREANVAGGTQVHLFWMSVVLLILTLGTEIGVLVKGLPDGTSELVVGRVLGLLDSVALMVLAYWYGTSSSSKSKDSVIQTALQK